MQIKTAHIKCSSCGAAIDLPEGALQTHFKCPFCSVENIILNDDITSGGLSHILSDAGVHRKLIEILSTAEYPPYDIFENINIKKVNRLIIPAYWFIACNGMANHTYDNGLTKEGKGFTFYDEDGDKHTIKRSTTDWTPCSAIINDIRDYLISANKEYNDIFIKFYGDISSPQIEEAKSLKFSDDAIETKSDWTEEDVTKRTLKDSVEKIIKEKAAEAVQYLNIQNEHLDNINIQKTNTKKISVGIYEIIFEYKDKEYKVYISHDGEKYICEELPNDPSLASIVEEKTKERDAADSAKRKILMTAIIITIVLGIVLLVAVVGIFLLLAAVVMIIFYIPLEKNLRAKEKELEEAIEQVSNGFNKVKEDFINNKVAMKGALSHVSGDPEAF